jgi:hypothetical protein
MLLREAVEVGVDVDGRAGEEDGFTTLTTIDEDGVGVTSGEGVWRTGDWGAGDKELDERKRGKNDET